MARMKGIAWVPIIIITIIGGLTALAASNVIDQQMKFDKVIDLTTRDIEYLRKVWIAINMEDVIQSQESKTDVKPANDFLQRGGFDVIGNSKVELKPDSSENVGEEILTTSKTYNAQTTSSNNINIKDRPIAIWERSGLVLEGNGNIEPAIPKGRTTDSNYTLPNQGAFYYVASYKFLVRGAEQPTTKAMQDIFKIANYGSTEIQSFLWFKKQVLNTLNNQLGNLLNVANKLLGKENAEIRYYYTIDPEIYLKRQDYVSRLYFYITKEVKLNFIPGFKGYIWISLPTDVSMNLLERTNIKGDDEDNKNIYLKYIYDPPFYLKYIDGKYEVVFDTAKYLSQKYTDLLRDAKYNIIPYFLRKSNLEYSTANPRTLCVETDDPTYKYGNLIVANPVEGKTEDEDVYKSSIHGLSFDGDWRPQYCMCITAGNNSPYNTIPEASNYVLNKNYLYWFARLEDKKVTYNAYWPGDAKFELFKVYPPVDKYSGFEYGYGAPSQLTNDKRLTIDRYRMYDYKSNKFEVMSSFTAKDVIVLNTERNPDGEENPFIPHQNECCGDDLWENYRLFENIMYPASSFSISEYEYCKTNNIPSSLGVIRNPYFSGKDNQESAPYFAVEVSNKDYYSNVLGSIDENEKYKIKHIEEVRKQLEGHISKTPTPTNVESKALSDWTLTEKDKVWDQTFKELNERRMFEACCNRKTDCTYRYYDYLKNVPTIDANNVFDIKNMDDLGTICNEKMGICCFDNRLIVDVDHDGCWEQCRDGSWNFSDEYEPCYYGSECSTGFCTRDAVVGINYAIQSAFYAATPNAFFYSNENKENNYLKKMSPASGIGTYYDGLAGKCIPCNDETILTMGSKMVAIPCKYDNENARKEYGTTEGFEKLNEWNIKFNVVKANWICYGYSDAYKTRILPALKTEGINAYYLDYDVDEKYYAGKKLEDKEIYSTEKDTCNLLDYDKNKNYLNSLNLNYNRNTVDAILRLRDSWGYENEREVGQVPNRLEALFILDTDYAYLEGYGTENNPEIDIPINNIGFLCKKYSPTSNIKIFIPIDYIRDEKDKEDSCDLNNVDVSIKSIYNANSGTKKIKGKWYVVFKRKSKDEKEVCGYDKRRLGAALPAYMTPGIWYCYPALRGDKTGKYYVLSSKYDKYRELNDENNKKNKDFNWRLQELGDTRVVVSLEKFITNQKIEEDSSDCNKYQVKYIINRLSSSKCPIKIRVFTKGYNGNEKWTYDIKELDITNGITTFTKVYNRNGNLNPESDICPKAGILRIEVINPPKFKFISDFSDFIKLQGFGDKNDFGGSLADKYYFNDNEAERHVNSIYDWYSIGKFNSLAISYKCPKAKNDLDCACFHYDKDIREWACWWGYGGSNGEDGGVILDTSENQYMPDGFSGAETCSGSRTCSYRIMQAPYCSGYNGIRENYCCKPCNKLSQDASYPNCESECKDKSGTYTELTKLLGEDICIKNEYCSEGACKISGYKIEENQNCKAVIEDCGVWKGDTNGFTSYINIKCTCSISCDSGELSQTYYYQSKSKNDCEKVKDLVNEIVCCYAPENECGASTSSSDSGKDCIKVCEDSSQSTTTCSTSDKTVYKCLAKSFGDDSWYECDSKTISCYTLFGEKTCCSTDYSETKCESITCYRCNDNGGIDTTDGCKQGNSINCPAGYSSTKPNCGNENNEENNG